MDLPESGFRQWLKKGNMSRFGLHFPVRGDAPHVQADPSFKGRLGPQSALPAKTRIAAAGAYDPYLDEGMSGVDPDRFNPDRYRGKVIIPPRSIDPNERLPETVPRAPLNQAPSGQDPVRPNFDKRKVDT